MATPSTDAFNLAARAARSSTEDKTTVKFIFIHVSSISLITGCLLLVLIYRKETHTLLEKGSQKLVNGEDLN